MNNEHKVIAGIDEVGRGCLVGSVVAAIVILNPKTEIAALMDSKKLSAKKREDLAVLIKKNAWDWAIARAEASEIDQLNILQATLLAMTRATSQLRIKPDWVQVDGTFFPDIPYPGETIIKGDTLVPEISAASIIAKVARDEEMKTLDALYPDYGFAKHKGYPTKFHLEKLASIGITEQHRKSFSPVQKQLA